MIKRFKFLFVFLTLFVMLGGVNAFAATPSQVYIYSNNSYINDSHFSFENNEEIGVNLTIEFATNAAGMTVKIPLIDPSISQSNSAIFKCRQEGLIFKIDNVIDGSGLPLPFQISNNYLIIECPADIPYMATISGTLRWDDAAWLANSADVIVNQMCSASIIGDRTNLTLAEWLECFNLQLDDIADNTWVLNSFVSYLQSIANNSSTTNSHLSQMMSSLNWIVSEMEGNVVGILMGDYAGYNYSQLLVEVIRSIQNISFGDIGDVTVQTDLTEVLSLLTNIFNSLDNLEDIEDKTAYLSEQLTLLITYLQDNTETLQSIGLDVQALLDLLASEEFLGYIEDRLDEMVEEQKLTNKTLQDILAALEDIRRSLIYGGGSGGGGGSATGNLFFEVLDGVLSGVFQLLSNLLGIVFKAVFGLFKWVTQFVGWINTDYLGGFFPAPIWAVVSVIIPLIVILGLIRFVRGFL